MCFFQVPRGRWLVLKDPKLDEKTSYKEPQGREVERHEGQRFEYEDRLSSDMCSTPRNRKTETRQQRRRGL